MHVDHLLSVETDSLAREVLITLKRDGLPPKNQWRDFMEQYALSGWDAASDAVAWATLATIAQWEDLALQVQIKGNLKVYESEEAVLRSEAKDILHLLSDGFSFWVVDQSPSYPYAVKIDFNGKEFWIDLRDDAVELEFKRVDIAPYPSKPRRVQVSGQEYDNTSLDFMSALTEALEPQPIGVMTVSGTLRIYTNEGLTPNVDIGVPEFSVGD